ncbi:DNA repair protein RadA [Aneurinibacillus sp. Ricciae_BoGa-3]|uniref:DNA repair protein RadA n=1 Tax=Aneurinibacillus sp. Ricciae_BoGa-3 TaxID=3022697 RepID=UPI00234192CE|nr:DNA repair protein RadA [Aneurinibacillus sp. Ricciae_BoGa-3]WCK54663.1 DNA repair protein RadA [Aneurinibacillus sp. Ricciae_BoGa-3]
MAKYKSKFVCQECGYESPKWMGKCPGCGSWNTLVEELEEKSRAGSSTRLVSGSLARPSSITSIVGEEEARLDTKLSELNRVLGGGVVPGSLVLVGGDPGIGKSTLLLQTSQQLAANGNKVLYISGEESARQIKLRAERLGANSENLYVLAETDLLLLEQQITDMMPSVVIIDSIQTIFYPDITSAPGSVAQVRECTAHLMKLAKTKEIAIMIVGHVTKQGAIAGPRLLEHMVDSVLYFEGERHNTYRILRAVKNRFGSTNEIGIFEMVENGLAEVLNPSEMFLSERSLGVAGSTVVASMEGTRPVLVELQALVTPTGFATPRRMATGVDYNRIAMIMAVLEKRVGLLLQNQDAYVNVAGGVRLDEPAVDLAIAVSLASSFRDKQTHPYDVVIGEVGLTGEVRGVSRIEQRVREAQKLGFKRVIIPAKNAVGWEYPQGLEVIGVHTVSDALRETLGG